MLCAKVISRKAALASLVVVALIWRGADALAQCALCRTAAENSDGAASAASAFNFAVLLLLTPPVIIFCAVFYLAYKHRDAFRSEPRKDSPRANLL